MATSTGASNSAATSSRTDHSGRTLRCVISARLGRPPMSGPLSSACTARSAARPKRCIDAWVTVAPAAGVRSPFADRSTAGRPARPSSPCSLIVSGSARRAHCVTARGPPASLPAPDATASWTVRVRRSYRHLPSTASRTLTERWRLSGGSYLPRSQLHTWDTRLTPSSYTAWVLRPVSDGRGSSSSG